MISARRQALDVSALETHGFGSRGVVWWGVLSFVAIETTMLGLCLASYFYLPTQAPDWRTGIPPPDLPLPTANTIVLLASLAPMLWTERAARRLDLGRVRIGLLASLAFGLVFCALRALELASLGFRWDDHAYGSIVWTTIGLHTAHLVAEVVETGVIAALFWTRDDLDPKYFVDAEDNAFYWYFIVAVWLPVYAVVFLSPRIL